MSRDAVGGADPQDAPPVPEPLEVDADEPPAGPTGAPGAARGRRARVLVAVAVAALLVGVLVGQRLGPATAGASGGWSEQVAAQVPRPSGYAVSLRDDDDPRATRVVVSWTGARDLAPERELVVAVVVDERTHVEGTRLGDRGEPDAGGGAASPATQDVAREVLREAGEDVTAERGVAVTAVRGRASGVLVVDVREDGPDVGVVTAPRVHLAVVQGTQVVHSLALPVGGRQARP